MFKKLLEKAKKLVLVKKIVSQKGVTHFRRWRLFWSPWGSVYLHHITNSDLDIDPHDHPWDFRSLILKGSYSEESRYPKDDYKRSHVNIFKPGMVNKKKTTEVHKLTLKSKSVWTLVFVGKRKHDWGYQTANGWVHHKEYNRLRRERKAREEFRWN